MLGTRIAALRYNRGWSQKELAEQLNISSSTLGSYEQGRREPSVDIIVELSRLFDVSIDFLLTGKICSDNDRIALDRLLSENTQCCMCPVLCVRSGFCMMLSSVTKKE